MKNRTEPQYEGQEHQFLHYEKALIYFIYSFTWDVSKTSWEKLQANLTSPLNSASSNSEQLESKGWEMQRLHERSVWKQEKKCVPNYQPSLVTQKRVLQRTGLIANGLTILAPIEEYESLKLKECREIKADLLYSVRLFENGGATCTFVTRLNENEANFENIHFALHLAHNVDSGDESEACHNHLTNSFIKLPLPENDDYDHSLIPADKSDSYLFAEGENYCSLHDLFRRLLKNPPDWAPDDAKEVWGDSDVIELNDLKQDFQSPYVFTIAEVERNSFLRFRKHSNLDMAREVGSILCKLTLDNRYIKEDFLHLSEDYFSKVLPYNNQRNGLINLCLDRRLFFTLSRRGAIAITAKIDDIPSYFVVPSLLNLCEILRTRWYMGSIVSAGLDKAISEIGSTPPNHDDNKTPLNAIDLMREMFKWRTLAGAFLRDPIPFLFDGGSISEIAEMADRLLWLDHLRIETTRKFDFLDNLIQDYLNIQRWGEFDWEVDDKSSTDYLNNEDDSANVE